MAYNHPRPINVAEVDIAHYTITDGEGRTIGSIEGFAFVFKVFSNESGRYVEINSFSDFGAAWDWARTHFEND